MTPSFSLAAIPLWLAPALLVAVAAALLLTRSRVPRLVALAPAAALLVLAPGARAAWTGETVLSFGTRLMRVGQLDLALGMAVDRVSLVVAAGLLVAWTGALVLSTEPSAARTFGVGDAARSLATCAAVLTGVLADGFPTLVLAALVVVLLVPMAPEAPRRSLARFFGFASAAVLSVALGAALLFWALGGRWLDESRYLSDFDARFVLAGAAEPEKGVSRVGRPGAQGTLTFVSHPGAKIYDGVADEAQLLRSQPIAISPAVAVPIVAGLHKIAIAPGEGAVVSGDGLEVALIDIVDIKEGKDTLIVLSGPSLTFHEITRQLAEPFGFAQRRLSSVPAAAAISAAFLASLLLAALALRERLAGAHGALAGAGFFGVLAVATARIAPCIVVTPATNLAFVLVATAAAIAWALPALRSGHRALHVDLLAPVAALAVAAAATAPLAPASAAAALALAAAVVRSSPAPTAVRAATDDTAKKKKKRKLPAADAKEGAEAPARSLADAGALATSALVGAPIPGGVLVLGAAGIAGAFAGMGAGNALAGLLILVAWAALGAIAWRVPQPASAWTGTRALAVLALVVGPATALALKPWDVPSNVAGDARAGIAAVAFAIVAGLSLRARSLARSDGPVEVAAVGEGGRELFAKLGRLLDRILGAPLDLISLAAPRAASRTEERRADG